MTYSTGDRLGPYEILSPLGEGGMGQVWKARDTRLNRTVAIKTSLKDFSERFEREAKAIAALNHPHICSVYDVGPNYLVMEYVEGRPLAGPVPIDEVLKIASQILDALDAAHRKGITHRDLKPGNILLGPNGVKVLDFGLAKMSAAGAGASGETATMTMPLTGEGAILGTLQYMAPEQLEGREADARSDIFAFGLIMYELVTGRRPFQGASQASLIASILKETPKPLKELQPATPESLERVIATCLEKDPEKRWQSAREVKHALEWMATSTIAGQIQAPVIAAKKSRAVPVAVAAALIVAVGGAAWKYWPTSNAPATVTRFTLPMPNNVNFNQYVSVSPDGRKMVFNATDESEGLWIRDLEALEWRAIPNTRGAVSPFWSPDSKSLGFSQGRQLKKVELSSSAPQTLAMLDFPVGTGAWSQDGTIVFGSRGANNPLWKVSQGGGQPEPLTKLRKGEAFHALPVFLPDQQHFLYLRTGDENIRGIYVGSLESKPEEQPTERVLNTSLAVSFANGYLFFMRERSLMAQTFDTSTFKLTGEPVQVAADVGITQSIGVFSVSPSGVLAYRTAAPTGIFNLTWFDRQGKSQGAAVPGTGDFIPRLSPDGSRAVSREGTVNGQGDLWVTEFARGIRTRFTFTSGPGSAGIWSRDGKNIVYSGGAARDVISEKPASGAGEARELLRFSLGATPTSLSPDNRYLLFQTITPLDMWVLPLEGDGKPVQLLKTPFNEGTAEFSPDGRWIAYTSTESGRAEVYVRPFVAKGQKGEPALGEGKWQISRDGGSLPHWTSNGKEIVFQGIPATRKMAVDVEVKGEGLDVGTPRLLFAGPLDDGWDVTADGKRFLLAVPEGAQDAQAPINVVMNWLALLKKN